MLRYLFCEVILVGTPIELLDATVLKLTLDYA